MESMVFYKSFYEATKELEPEVQAEIYNAIFMYAFEGEEPEGLSTIAKSIYTMAKPQIDANNRRKENGKKGAEYGKLGGRPKTKTEEKNPIGVINKNPIGDKTKTPNVNDNDNDNENDNEKRNIKEKKPHPEKYEQIRSLYNTTCTKLLPCKAITKTRIDLIDELMEAFKPEEIEDVFLIANKSPWLTGENDKGWKADFDWIINLDNFARIQDGRYGFQGEKKKSGFKDFQQSQYDWDEINRELGIKENA